MNELERLAAEYVLGTLDSDTRQQISLRRLDEPDLEALISDWEARLSPLLDEVEEVTPKADLWSRIEQRLNDSGATRTTASIQGPIATDELGQLRQQLSRWRAAAVGGFGIAAGLLVALLLGNPLAHDAMVKTPHVAVFQSNDEQPAFLMTVDLDTRQLKIEPVKAQGVSGKTYQLWIKSDRLGPGVHSLGLLESADLPTRKKLQDYDPELLRSATFGISLEPEGGSPTGQPTGPAIHGTLYDTSI
ncbi:anti-sigma factor [Allohahella marinimesophila]|uniref:Anti-sigma factor n=1 Tax=Allohahella marinimesophila TaxID=1054972 RepID=A0ABP7PZY5_9GAMM